MRVTSKLCEVTPSANAVARSGEEGRISSPITTVAGSLWISRKRAKATPTAKANSSVTSPSTRPRMSYALIIRFTVSRSIFDLVDFRFTFVLEVHADGHGDQPQVECFVEQAHSLQPLELHLRLPSDLLR